MKYLQKLGKAIMLPVAVLPVAAIMMGIGYAMCPATMQGGDVTGIIQIIGFALVKIGSAVIDKLPMLFAVGVAIGLSKGPARCGRSCRSGCIPDCHHST